MVYRVSTIEGAMEVAISPENQTGGAADILPLVNQEDSGPPWSQEQALMTNAARPRYQKCAVRRSRSRSPRVVRIHNWNPLFEKPCAAVVP